jgi:hypothetical protein
MRKPVLVFLLAFFAWPILVFSQSSEESEFTPYFAASVQPYALWAFSSGQLNLDCDPNLFTRLEVDIEHRSKLKFGVSVDVNNAFFTKTDQDNNFVDTLSSIAGTLGYDDLMLMVSNGKISGTADWRPGAASGSAYASPESFRFDNKYFSVDLVHTTFIFDLIGLGINYTRFSLPVELTPYDTYDPNATFATYGLTLWIDHLYYHLKNNNYGFNLWLEDLSRLNFGPMNLSDTGKKNYAVAKASYTGYDYEVNYSNTYTLLLEINLNAGVCYIFEDIDGALAFGYGVTGQMLGMVGDSILGMRHGFVVKGAIQM